MAANGDGDRALKQHLDRYVIGQDRSKRVLSTAIYHHYQRVALLRKHELERQEMLLQEQSRAFALDAFGGFSFSLPVHLVVAVTVVVVVVVVVVADIDRFTEGARGRALRLESNRKYLCYRRCAGMGRSPCSTSPKTRH